MLSQVIRGYRDTTLGDEVESALLGILLYQLYTTPLLYCYLNLSYVPYKQSWRPNSLPITKLTKAVVSNAVLVRLHPGSDISRLPFPADDDYGMHRHRTKTTKGSSPSQETHTLFIVMLCFHVADCMYSNREGFHLIECAML